MSGLFDVQDGLSAFFLFCTFFGLFFTIISLVFGAVGSFDGPGGIGGHFGHVGHVGHAGHAHIGGHNAHAGTNGHAASGHANQGHSDNSGISPLNLSTIMIFVTWFGAAGYLLHRYTGFWSVLVVVLATLAGLIGGAFMYAFLTRVLYRATTPAMRESDYDLEGRTATVTSTIYENGIGEITYSLHGYRRSESARSVTGQQIARGTEVVVLRYEKGVAYVQGVEEILAQQLPAPETLKADILKQEQPKEDSPPLITNAPGNRGSASK